MIEDPEPWQCKYGHPAEQPRGTVLLSAKDYRNERDDMIELRKELTKLRAVAGPRLECGRYAVEHSRCESLDNSDGTVGEVTSVYCPGDPDDSEKVTEHAVTPEYLAWRSAREGGR